MPDDFDYFGNYFQRRARNLFPSYGESEPDPNSPDSVGFNKNAFRVQPYGSSYYPRQEEESDYESSYTPSSTLRRYLDLTSSAPKREDYKPSKWGTALATIAGAAEGYRGGPNKGIASATAIRDMPYTRAAEEHDYQTSQAAAALKSEQQESTLKSMADYRGGQLTEKARERLRKEGAEAAKITLGQQKENRLGVQFGQGLAFDREKLTAEMGLKNRLAEIESKYKSGIISVREAQNRIEEALGEERNRIYGQFAGAATISAQANQSRAESYAQDVENEEQREANKPSPLLEPSAQRTADTLAVEEVRRTGNYDEFFDDKGNIKPVDNSSWWTSAATQSRYQQMLREIEAKRRGYVNTPKPVVPRRNPSSSPTGQVEKRDW